MEEKLFYTISEIAGRLGVNVSLVRFWEKEVAVVKPIRNGGGKRRYTQEDLQKLQTFYHLVKVKGYTLQGAMDALKNQGKKENKNPTREKLEDVYRKLKQWHEKM
jgi:DNA-binding transcriptional MerR regulator